jgi:hypothetical protein
VHLHLFHLLDVLVDHFDDVDHVDVVVFVSALFVSGA